MRLRTPLLCLLTVAACSDADRPPAAVAPNAAAVTADGQYAPSAMIVRFRAQVPEHPAALGGGATTDRDSLLARYVRGVERRDTTALDALHLTVSEFAWLYYLDSPMAQPPYELDPDVMWLQITSQGGRGLTRTLQRYGGTSLGAWRSACAPPRASGPTGALRLHDCTLTFRPTGSAADATLRLSVVERDGRFKLASLATSL